MMAMGRTGRMSRAYAQLIRHGTCAVYYHCEAMLVNRRIDAIMAVLRDDGMRWRSEDRDGD